MSSTTKLIAENACSSSANKISWDMNSPPRYSTNVALLPDLTEGHDSTPVLHALAQQGSLRLAMAGR
jgi:hypothetical protein